MTLLFIDGYDHYATAELNQKDYSFSLADNHAIVAGQGRRGTQCFRAAGLNNGAIATLPLVTPSDTLVVGLAWQANQFPTTTKRKMIEIIDSGNNALLTVYITSAGELELVSGVDTSTTATNLYAPQVYAHYEVKYVKGSGADGFAEVRKDGIILLTHTTTNETAQAQSIRLLELGAGSETMQMDDLYVLDGLGAVNNDYLGDVRVDTYYMTEDGAQTDFTPFSGVTNFGMVDETLVDGDASFVDSGTISNEDYHKTDEAVLNTQIYGVQPVLSHRKTDAGIVTMNLKTNNLAGAGKRIGIQETSNDAYSMTHEVHETDPDDSATWTDTKINDTEWGFSIVNITT